MTRLDGPFPDIEKALVTALPGLLVSTAGPVTVKTDTPDDLEAHLPFIRITVSGGADDGYTNRPFVDVDVFAATRADGYALAEQTRGLLLSARRLGDVTIDRVLTTSGPKRVPWEDGSTIRRFLATYRVSTRR